MRYLALLLLACGGEFDPPPSKPSVCGTEIAVTDLNRLMHDCRHWNRAKYIELNGKQHEFYWCDEWY